MSKHEKKPSIATIQTTKHRGQIQKRQVITASKILSTLENTGV
jgi:hypothetical protein